MEEDKTLKNIEITVTGFALLTMIAIMAYVVIGLGLSFFKLVGVITTILIASYIIGLTLDKIFNLYE